MTKIPGLLWGLIIPLVCVVIISAGQMLFKLASAHFDFRRPFADPKGLWILVIALILYGFATLLWVAALRTAPLSRIYPIMALAFVLVPLGSFLILKEPLSLQYWFGAGLIIAGMAIIGRSFTS